MFSQLYILRKLKQILPTDDVNCVYYGIFQSIIDYCITVWGSAAQKYLCKIQKLQAARHLAQNFDWNIRGIDIVRGLGWQNVNSSFTNFAFMRKLPSFTKFAFMRNPYDVHA